MDILGIETSCDETSAAVVRDGREVISNVVYTQIPLHRPYGVVVPEIASRAHVEKIHQVISDALGGRKVDAVAVTYGPGLAPALLVGVNAAKGLAKALKVPLIGVNHIEAHLRSPFLFDSPSPDPSAAPDPRDVCPALGLVVSGGNTILVDMPEYGKYEVIGETLDDAAGEAFDKAAKLLGLGYPGGLVIDRISEAFARENPGLDFIPFPKGRPREGVSALAGLPASLCVSFSGLKPALMRYLQAHPEISLSGPGERDWGGHMATPEAAHVIASYQHAIVEAVSDRVRTALSMRPRKAFVLGGGVSLNSGIRKSLSALCLERGVKLYMAKPKYTGDNAAMIAALAMYRRRVEGAAAMRMDAMPALEIGGACCSQEGAV